MVTTSDERAEGNRTPGDERGTNHESETRRCA